MPTLAEKQSMRESKRQNDAHTSGKTKDEGIEEAERCPTSEKTDKNKMKQKLPAESGQFYIKYKTYNPPAGLFLKTSVFALPLE